MGPNRYKALTSKYEFQFLVKGDKVTGCIARGSQVQREWQKLEGAAP